MADKRWRDEVTRPPLPGANPVGSEPVDPAVLHASLPQTVEMLNPYPALSGGVAASGEAATGRAAASDNTSGTNGSNGYGSNANGANPPGVVGNGDVTPPTPGATAPSGSSAPSSNASPATGFVSAILEPTAAYQSSTAKPESNGRNAATVPSPAAAKTVATEKSTLVALPGDEEPHGGGARILRTSLSCTVSMLIHLVLIVALGLWILPPVIKQQIEDLSATVADRPDEILNQVLDEQTDPTRELALVNAGGGSNLAGAEGGIGPGTIVGPSNPEMDPALTETVDDAPHVDVGDMAGFAAGGAEMSSEVPEGTFGEPSAIVDNYQHAMDRITQEILNQLSKSKVLVIWCFDQSNSMKDDQREIRERIERVYTELGLSDSTKGEALWTAVGSFGQRWVAHTQRPTSNLDEIRAAIDSVPVDETGQEMMCPAVSESIEFFRRFSRQRRVMLVLVTDESGQLDNNALALETTIQQAKSARCGVYVLGREAVFGYPYAYMLHTDKETQIGFWLQIDRGPETAFAEQLQIDGFTRRWDAFPSGFGPYSQTRLARETGGIFFMLPSPETNLVRGDNRKYELEAMRPYLPDLMDRNTYLQQRQGSELQQTMWQVISDLDPYNPSHAKYVELPVNFSIVPEQFAQQAQDAKQVADGLVQYIHVAEKAMEKIAPLRKHEYNPRWKANYDLMFAQLLAYKVRIYEYRSYLDAFLKTPKVIKNPLGPERKTNNWELRTRAETITGEETKAYIVRATALLNKIVAEHPGTPWAARAQWELNRGFGVDLVEDYDDPRASMVKLPNL